MAMCATDISDQDWHAIRHAARLYAATPDAEHADKLQTTACRAFEHGAPLVEVADAAMVAGPRRVMHWLLEAQAQTQRRAAA